MPPEYQNVTGTLRKHDSDSDSDEDVAKQKIK